MVISILVSFCAVLSCPQAVLRGGLKHCIARWPENLSCPSKARGRYVLSQPPKAHTHTHTALLTQPLSLSWQLFSEALQSLLDRGVLRSRRPGWVVPNRHSGETFAFLRNLILPFVVGIWVSPLQSSVTSSLCHMVRSVTAVYTILKQLQCNPSYRTPLK